MQGNNGNFDSSEHYNLNNDEAYLYHNMIEPIPMGIQENSFPGVSTFREYVELEGTQQLIDSSTLQNATSSVNLCSTESVQNIQHVSENVPCETPSRHRRRRRRSSASEAKSSKKSFPEAVENLLGPFDDEASRTSRPVPEFDNWYGTSKFCISLPAEQNGPDGVVVAYSEPRNKMYVKKDQPFNVTFFTASAAPIGTKIKVMGMFTQQNHMSEIVKRCDRHTISDYEKGSEAPDHLILCDSNQSMYLRDSSSGRRYLTVPYENTQDTDFYPYVAYPFKFTCSGNCIGGLNGRPFRVIFTLENGNAVIGRQSVEVKICTDPHKEMVSDNKKAPMLSQEPSEPETTKSDFTDKKRKFHLLEDGIGKTTSEEESPGNGPFQIMVPDKEMYEFIVLFQQQYRLAKNLQKLSPHIMQYLANCQKKKKKKE